MNKIDPLITRERLLEPAGVKKINELVDEANAGYTGEFEIKDHGEVTHTLVFENGKLISFSDDDD